MEQCIYFWDNVKRGNEVRDSLWQFKLDPLELLMRIQKFF